MTPTQINNHLVEAEPAAADRPDGAEADDGPVHVVARALGAEHLCCVCVCIFVFFWGGVGKKG